MKQRSVKRPVRVAMGLKPTGPVLGQHNAILAQIRLVHNFHLLCGVFQSCQDAKM